MLLIDVPREYLLPIIFDPIPAEGFFQKLEAWASFYNVPLSKEITQYFINKYTIQHNRNIEDPPIADPHQFSAIAKTLQHNSYFVSLVVKKYVLIHFSVDTP
jgi:hypothetical protein